MRRMRWKKIGKYMNMSRADIEKEAKILLSHRMASLMDNGLGLSVTPLLKSPDRACSIVPILTLTVLRTASMQFLCEGCDGMGANEFSGKFSRKRLHFGVSRYSTCRHHSKSNLSAFQVGKYHLEHLDQPTMPRHFRPKNKQPISP